MKRWKCSVVGLLIAAAFVTTASAHSHPGEPIPPVPTVSPWAQEEVKKAQNLGLVPKCDLPEDYRTPITRENFRSLAMEYVAVQEHYDSYSLGGMVSFYLAEREPDGTKYGSAKSVFSDGSTDDSAAYYLGIVKGRGNETFDPEGRITRQEAAVMLTRAYGVCGGILPEEEAETGFKDGEKIADWAKESAASLASWKVMNGLEDGSFSPGGKYSVEQCIVTFLRLYENAPVSRKHGNVTPLFSYDQGIGYLEDSCYEAFRIEGPAATLFRGELGIGTMHASSRLWFIYRDGGMKDVDIGVCNGNDMGFPELDACLPLENPHFSEDGKTFYCTAAISDDTLTYEPFDRPLFHEKGIYHITIDVDTCQYQLQREDLPAKTK